MPYLQYLYDRFIANGGIYIKKNIRSLHEALQATETRGTLALINCSGVGSKYLSDVHDDSVHFARGQTCDVHAPWLSVSKLREKDNSFIWVFPLSEGKVRIGATFEIDDM